jgi:hypothetical protein
VKLERSVSGASDGGVHSPLAAIVAFLVFSVVAVLLGQPWRSDGEAGILRLATPAFLGLIQTAFLARRYAQARHAWLLPAGFAIAAALELAAIAWVLVVR